MVKSLITCDCLGSQSIDADGLAKATGLEVRAPCSALCTRWGIRLCCRSCRVPASHCCFAAGRPAIGCCRANDGFAPSTARDGSTMCWERRRPVCFSPDGDGTERPDGRGR